MQPKITKPIGTAQSTISLLDMNNESALYHGRSETNAKPTQSHPSHRRGSPHPRHAGSHFVRENAGFHAIPNTQTSPGHSSSTAICNHCLANHTTTASTTAEINKVDAAITLQTATQDHQTQWHSAVNHLMAWLENALYNGRSETNAKPTQPHPSHRRGSPHRRREPLCAKKHRVSCDSETSPLRSSSNAICTHCLVNHTTTAPTTSAINKMDAAIPIQTATQ